MNSQVNEHNSLTPAIRIDSNSNAVIRRANKICGTLSVPGDKSISHRAVMLGALAHGTTEISGFLSGDDCLRTIDCFRKMGISIEITENTKVRVEGRGLHGLRKPDTILYTGNSGTTTRMLLGILAGQPFESSVDGDQSIRKRPMKRVIEPLRMMGARITAMDGSETDNCPLAVHPSRLTGIDYNMPVASAQVKSAILLAGLFSDGPVIVRESIPSRDHTERMMKAFGAKLTVSSTPSGGSVIVLEPGNTLMARKIDIPGDISSAAYFITAAMIIPDSVLLLEGIGLNPSRTGLIDAYRQMGADIAILNEREANGEPVGDIQVRSSCGRLRGIEIGGAIIPRLIDEIPVLAVAAAFANGTTVIRNAEELKVKESNRIQAVVSELSRFGVNIRETEDGMIIEGGTAIKGAVIDTHKDHRIAMAMAVAGLAAEGETIIENSDVVNISFPDFFHRLSSIAF